jgi:hypothetical protein
MKFSPLMIQAAPPDPKVPYLRLEPNALDASVRIDPLALYRFL